MTSETINLFDPMTIELLLHPIPLGILVATMGFCYWLMLKGQMGG